VGDPSQQFFPHTLQLLKSFPENRIIPVFVSALREMTDEPDEERSYIDSFSQHDLPPPLPFFLKSGHSEKFIHPRHHLFKSSGKERIT
jgi:hypothetical protein